MIDAQASRHGRTQVATLLMKHGADPSIRNRSDHSISCPCPASLLAHHSFESTALDYAIERSHRETVKALRAVLEEVADSYTNELPRTLIRVQADSPVKELMSPNPGTPGLYEAISPQRQVEEEEFDDASSNYISPLPPHAHDRLSIKGEPPPPSRYSVLALPDQVRKADSTCSRYSLLRIQA